jgi:hypothetical protein
LQREDRPLRMVVLSEMSILLIYWYDIRRGGSSFHFVARYSVLYHV